MHSLAISRLIITWGCIVMLLLYGCRGAEPEPHKVTHNGEGSVLASKSDPCSYAAPEGPWYPVLKGGRWGYMDQSGQQVLSCTFVSAGWTWMPEDPYSQEVLPSGDWVVVDRNGQEVYRPGDNSFSLYGHVGIEERAESEEPNTVDLIAIDSGEVLASFSEAGAMGDNGLIPVSRNGVWGYIDAHGRTAIPFRFTYAFAFQNGLAKARSTKGGEGYIDRSGTWVIPPEYAKGGLWASEGLIPVKKGRGYVYITMGNREAFPGLPPFRFAAPFGGGIACVWMPNGVQAVINQRGEYVMPPKRERSFPSPASEGLVACVVKNQQDEQTKAGYVDGSGAFVILVDVPAELSSFEGGLARVRTPEGVGYIDRQGDWVWKPRK